jgi:hypothetical protein
MQRKLSILSACLFALVFCAPGRSQDSPSLGDLARQAQKNKSTSPAKKVLTNDDISSGSTSGNGLTSSGMGSIAAPAPARAPAASTAQPSAEEAAGQLEALINKIAGLSRAELVSGALQGVDANFPGRNEWEQRLLSARQVYVERGRDLLRNAKQIQATAESLRGTQDPNDPRVKDLTSRLEGLVRDGTRLDASFQAVILEGRDLAAHASGQ